MEIPKYISLKEKKRIFGRRYRCISDVGALKQWHKEHDISFSEPQQYLFRGVNEACFKNFTSAQRMWFLSDIKDKATPQQLVNYQIESLKNSFENLLSRYCFELALPFSDLYVLCFSQHYGGISPLLDFSLSLNKALFFMSYKATVEDAGIIGEKHISNYVSLYYIKLENFHSVVDEAKIIIEKIINDKSKGVNRQSLIDKSIEDSFSYPNLRQKWGNTQNLIIRLCQNYRYDEKNDERYHALLLLSNLNSVAQHGQFIYSDNGIEPFETNLFCVDIHKSLIPYIKSEILNEWRYTEQALFPKPEEIVGDATNKTLLYAVCPELEPDYKKIRHEEFNKLMAGEHVSL